MHSFYVSLNDSIGSRVIACNITAASSRAFAGRDATAAAPLSGTVPGAGGAASSAVLATVALVGAASGTVLGAAPAAGLVTAAAPLSGLHHRSACRHSRRLAPRYL